MWAASAQANRAHYCHPAIDTPTVAVKHFDLGELKKCGPVTQHGVGDTRRLSRYDAGSGQVVTDGPIATIKPILGAVDWPPRYFESPIPIAIIDLPAQNAAYRKLGLLPGRNYWIVMLDHGVWRGWMQSDVQPGGATPPPAVPLEMLNPVPYDAEAPVQNAQFVWYDKDEGLWGVCAGKCCRTKPVL